MGKEVRAEVRYAADELREFAAGCFEKVGMPSERVKVVADVLVEGDLMGHTTHGLACMGPYLKEIEAGSYLVEGDPVVVSDRGSVVLWDGQYLLGPWLVSSAMDTALERVEDHPVVTVVIRKSAHIGNLSSYLLRPVERGLICLLLSSDPSVVSVAPYGTARPLYTPNPVAAGIPTAGDPILFDITMSTTSNGKVSRLKSKNESFPDPWLIDAEGHSTGDPGACFTDPPGAILPLGGMDLGYKGFALGVLVEALTSGLGGFGRASGANTWGGSIFLQVIDPSAFGGSTAFRTETSWFAGACRECPPVPGAPPVRMPGDRALALRRDQLKKGVLLHPGVLPTLEEWSDKLGIPFPEPVSE